MFVGEGGGGGYAVGISLGWVGGVCGGGGSGLGGWGGGGGGGGPHCPGVGRPLHDIAMTNNV